MLLMKKTWILLFFFINSYCFFGEEFKVEWSLNKLELIACYNANGWDNSRETTNNKICSFYRKDNNITYKGSTVKGVNFLFNDCDNIIGQTIVFGDFKDLSLGFVKLLNLATLDKAMFYENYTKFTNKPATLEYYAQLDDYKACYTLMFDDDGCLFYVTYFLD